MLPLRISQRRCGGASYCWLLFAYLLLLNSTVVAFNSATRSPLFRSIERLQRYGSTSGNNAADNIAAAIDSDSSTVNQSEVSDTNPFSTFAKIVNDRHACKRFLRFDGKDESHEDYTKQASMANPQVVQIALDCLQLAQRAPTSFNAQPYKVVLVKDAKTKTRLARVGGLGPNKQRILDSDCTAVFLADRQVCKTFSHYRQGVCAHNPRRKYTKMDLFKVQFYISLFSSSYPFLPRVLSVIASYFVRVGMHVGNAFTSLRPFNYPLPSLGNAETWAVKQTSMVGLTFVLACTAQNLATLPMEGLNAHNIRRVVKAPRRYSIPFVVSVGKAKLRPTNESIKRKPSWRYPTEQTIYTDTFDNNTI